MQTLTILFEAQSGFFMLCVHSLYFQKECEFVFVHSASERSSVLELKVITEAIVLMFSLPVPLPLFLSVFVCLAVSVQLSVCLSVYYGGSTGCYVLYKNFYLGLLLTHIFLIV